MSSNVTYQLKIVLNDSGLNDASLGIASGVMYLTTGDDYTYSGIVYKGNVLLESGIPEFTQYIDIQTSGGYANFSTIRVSLNAVDGLLSFIRSNGVILRGSKVYFYSSIDRADPVVRWVGKIDEQGLSRSHIELSCVDEFNAIHGNHPSKVISAGDDALIPLLLGNDKAAKLVEKNGSTAFNFSLQSNAPTLAEGSTYILGYSDNPSIIQGTADLKRNFHVNGWNIIALYCGNNASLVVDSLTDYYLTFKNEVTGRTFFSKILSNTVSVQYSFGANGNPLYYTQVALDKAIPYELEEISDEGLKPGWSNDAEDETLTVNRSNKISRFRQYGYSFPSSPTYPNRNGDIAPFNGRWWALVDRTVLPNYQSTYLAFPQNYPTKCTYAGAGKDPLINYGTMQWEPIERISKVAFKPYSWNTISYLVNDNGVLETSLELTFPCNILKEPFFNGVGYTAGIFNDSVVLSETTACTLRHKDSFAEFWVGENGYTGTSAEQTLFTKDGETLLRYFEYEDGKIKATGPEWAHRLYDFGEDDLSKLGPYKKSYPVYSTNLKWLNVASDNFIAATTTLGPNNWANFTTGYGTVDKQNLSQFYVFAAINDLEENIFDFSGNVGDNWEGVTSDYKYKYSPSASMVETEAVGRCPVLVPRYPIWGSYYRSVCESGVSMVFPVEKNAEFNFMARVPIYKYGSTNTDMGTSDDFAVHINIKAYASKAAALANQNAVYESGWNNCITKQYPYNYWDTMIAQGRSLIVQFGDVSFDVDDTYPTDYVPCVFPSWLKKNYETASFIRVEVMVGVDSINDIRIGLHPSFINMVSYADISSGVNAEATVDNVESNLTYLDAVNEVFTSIDAVPASISYDKAESDETYVLNGGGIPGIGKQITDKTYTFDLCKDFASKGFFGIVPNTSGVRELKPWLYEKAPKKMFSTLQKSDYAADAWVDPFAGMNAYTTNTDYDLVDGVNIGASGYEASSVGASWNQRYATINGIVDTGIDFWEILDKSRAKYRGVCFKVRLSEYPSSDSDFIKFIGTDQGKVVLKTNGTLAYYGLFAGGPFNLSYVIPLNEWVTIGYDVKYDGVDVGSCVWISKDGLESSLAISQKAIYQVSSGAIYDLGWVLGIYGNFEIFNVISANSLYANFTNPIARNGKWDAYAGTIVTGPSSAYTTGDIIKNNGNVYQSLIDYSLSEPPSSDWRYLQPVSHTNIEYGSLSSLSSTPYSMIYTHAKFEYGKDATGKATEYLEISNTDQASFPAIDDYTYKSVAPINCSISYSWNSGVAYIVMPTVSLTDAMSAGNILILDYTIDILVKVLGIVPFDATYSYIYITRVENPEYDQNFTGTADVYETSGQLVWKTYVSASENIEYGSAQLIWQGFRNAYLRRGGRNDLPSSLANVPEIYANENRSGTNILEYLKNILNWVTFQKDKASLNASLIDVNDLEILDCVTVEDPFLTSGQPFTGWVYDMKLNTSSNIMSLGIIFDKSPFDPIVEPLTIDELFDNGGLLPINNYDEGLDDTVNLNDVDEN